MANKEFVESTDGKAASNSGQGNESKEDVCIVKVEQWRQIAKREDGNDNDCLVFAPKSQQSSINSRKAWYRCQLGRAFWALGLVEEALEQFKKACEMMPHEPLYRLELAEAYIALNRLNEAIDQLEQTILWAPYDAYYHIRLAAAYLRAGKLDDAIEVMEKTVKLDPRNASYHCLLGALYLMRGDEERATFHLKFRWQLDQYDRSFLRQFQKLCGNLLRFPLPH